MQKALLRNFSLCVRQNRYSSTRANNDESEVIEARNKICTLKPPMPDINLEKWPGSVDYDPDGAIVYKYFKYYPRVSEKEDRPVQPSKLFMVKRKTRSCYVPWFHKEVMDNLGLRKINDIIITRNTHQMNQQLWKIKHLIEIHPVTFPQGTPSESNIDGATLLEDGRLVFKQEYVNVDNQIPEFKNKKDDRRIEYTEIKKLYLKKWQKSWRSVFEQ